MIISICSFSHTNMNELMNREKEESFNISFIFCLFNFIRLLFICFFSYSFEVCELVLLIFLEIILIIPHIRDSES